MNKLTATNKVIVVVVVVLVAWLVIWKLNAPAPQSPAAPETNTPANNGTTATSTGTTPGTGTPTAPKTGGTKTTSPSPSAIIFVTPVPGDTWKIMTTNPIQWSRAAETTGQIELLDAATHAYVGEILNSTGVNQTSYAWNTRDINLSRTNPAKKNVVPGRYVIRIEFDGLHLAPITSQPFTIVSQ